MHDFKDLQRNSVLNSSRIRISDPDEATLWQCLRSHSKPHKLLEGGCSVAHSAKYTPQMCPLLARHAMKQPVSLVNPFGGVVFQDKPRTQSLIADPAPLCMLCGEQDDELVRPTQSTGYDPPDDEEEDQTFRNLMVVHRNLRHPSNKL